MKRFLPLLILAAATILSAQAPNQATLRTPSGDRLVTITHVEGQTFFAADDVMAGLGGSVPPDGAGFKASLNNNLAAFGPDSRFGVIRDELIEMPSVPVVVGGRPYVPWQFFQGCLGKTVDMEVTWDPVGRVLVARPAQHTIVGVQLSVANIQGISKVVIGLTAPTEYAIVKDQMAYTIRFKTPIRAPFPEQSYDDPYVSKATFSGNDLRLDLKTPDVAADAYKLDSPFRILLDFHKGAAGAKPSPGLLTPNRPIDTPGSQTTAIEPPHRRKEVAS